MKKIMSLVITMLILVSMFSLVGCGGKDKVLSNVKEKGKLVVGTSADYPPYEFKLLENGGEEIVGMDIEIIKEIAKDLDVELEIRDIDFSGLLAALSSGKVDMVIAGMTPDEERLKSADFSEIYYFATHGVVVPKGKEDTIKSFDDLEGKVIGVQQGTIQADMAKEVNNPKEIKEVPRITDLILMLTTGKIDAAIMELPVAKTYVSNNDQLGLTSVEVSDEDGGSAIAVNKGNPSFIEEINVTLNRLLEEDRIKEFFKEAALLADTQKVDNE